MSDININHKLHNINKSKYESELDWHVKAYAKRKGKASNEWYEKHYTSLFNIDKEFYSNKRILDIGCGPLGSLEWADKALMRIGLDPLANEYMKIGANAHAMAYVVSPGEEIPFPDNYFDVVSSFNNIDHVDDINRVIGEIKRVCAPGGVFLLITDLHENPTTNEPQCISWDFVEQFKDVFTIKMKFELEKKIRSNLYKSVAMEIPFDHSDSSERYGILKCMMVKKMQ